MLRTRKPCSVPTGYKVHGMLDRQATQGTPRYNSAREATPKLDGMGR